MDNSYLTGCGASKDAGFNKMPNPIALKNTFKINKLQKQANSLKKNLYIFLLALFVHKCFVKVVFWRGNVSAATSAICFFRKGENAGARRVALYLTAGITDWLVLFAATAEENHAGIRLYRHVLRREPPPPHPLRH